MKHQVHWLDRGWMPTYIGCCFNEKAFWNDLARAGIKRTDCRDRSWTPEGGAKCWQFSDCYGSDSKSVAMITMDPKTADGEEISTVAALIAHEAVHAKQFVCSETGDHALGIEVEVYCVQTITAQVLHKLIKLYKPKFK